MDYIDLMQQQVNKWQGEQKCGLCWEFDAPLLDSGVNKSQNKGSDCCVYVFVTNISVREVRNYDNTTSLLRDRYDEVSLTIELLRKADIGDNVYRELDYPLNQSKWNNLIQPIKDCLGSDVPFDFCELLNRNLPITSRSWAVITNNKDDNNYVGWRVNLTIRDNEPTSNYLENVIRVNLIDVDSTPISGSFIFTGVDSETAYTITIINGFGYFINSGNDLSFTNNIPSLPVSPVSQNTYNEIDLKTTD